jgi:DNA-binding CsgD family transcriptional regulator
MVRQSEWQRVREFCEATPPVGTSALCVLGEAGAGKSTLWRAGVHVAAGAGHRVLRTEASEAEAGQSFAGLSDLFTGLLPDFGGGIPEPQLDALQVALLLQPAAGEPPTVRALGLGILAVLRQCVSLGPVLVAIDEAQWLDQASLDVLAFALRRVLDGPLSLLLAARTPAPADPLTLGAPSPSVGWRALLAGSGDVSFVNLAPLEVSQIGKLLPPATTAAELTAVAERSRGNPFWALEVGASLRIGDSQLPPVASTLTSRLARSLTPDAAAALSVVAAAGRIAPHSAVAVLDALAEPEAAIDAAVIAGVVVESDETLTAAHPLIGAAALEAIPPGQRRRLYESLVAHSSNPERRGHFARLAAGSEADASVASVLDTAAEAAHSRGGNTEAARFAVEAVKMTPAGDETALVRRRVRAGELLFLAGDMGACWQHLDGLDIATLQTEELERALPLLLDVTNLVGESGQAAEIVRRVVDCTNAGDLRRRALVLAIASDIEYGVGGARRANAIEAIKCAEAAGPPAAASLHRALINLVDSKATGGDGLDKELLDRARIIETGLPAIRLHDSADMNLGLWSRYTEDLDTARVALRLSIDRAREAGDDFALVAFLAYLAETEVLAGDYEAARSVLTALDETAAWHDWTPSPWFLEPRCDLLIADGDLDGAVDLVDRHLSDEADSPPAARFISSCIRGRASTWKGDPVAVVSHLERAAAYADEYDWVDPGVRNRIDPLLAEAYMATGKPAQAEHVAKGLREVGERLSRPALVGDAYRIEAIGAAGEDLDTAARLAASAVEAHASSPLLLEEARSLLVLGRIERGRRARRAARLALERADELAHAIGHKPFQAEVGRELPRPGVSRSEHELTSTERRVADLIAAGATNREAAAELFVSVRTIETHVAAIYRKLGVRTRAELARRYAP